MVHRETQRSAAGMTCRHTPMNPRSEIPGVASESPMRPARRSALGRAILVAGLVFAMLPAISGWERSARAQDQPNLFERRIIEKDAIRAFQQIITLWREELYFELYDEGWADSRARITLEEFAQRMVELPWVPRGELDAKFLETDFRHRTMVYLNARMAFRHKFDPTKTYTKNYSTLLMKEDGRWRIDLIQIIRAPYS